MGLAEDNVLFVFCLVGCWNNRVNHTDQKAVDGLDWFGFKGLDQDRHDNSLLSAAFYQHCLHENRIF